MNKIGKLLLHFVLLFFMFTESCLAMRQQPIPLDSEYGRQILLHSKLNLSYLRLSGNYTTQKNQAYCSIASGVMVLNALQIKPLNLLYNRYPYIDQDNFFSDEMLQKTNIASIMKCGLTVDELAVFLNYYPVEVTVTHAADGGYAHFIHTLEDTFSSAKQYMIIDFYRPTLNQCGLGHFSPVAAYDSESNKVLIMDVARYKLLPYWVDAHDLWDAMLTIDETNNLTRGFIIVKKL
jgi:Phytochelatin synthase